MNRPRTHASSTPHLSIHNRRVRPFRHRRSTDSRAPPLVAFALRRVRRPHARRPHAPRAARTHTAHAYGRTHVRFARTPIVPVVPVVVARRKREHPGHHVVLNRTPMRMRKSNRCKPQTRPESSRVRTPDVVRARKRRSRPSTRARAPVRPFASRRDGLQESTGRRTAVLLSHHWSMCPSNGLHQCITHRDWCEHTVQYVTVTNS